METQLLINSEELKKIYSMSELLGYEFKIMKVITESNCYSIARLRFCIGMHQFNSVKEVIDYLYEQFQPYEVSKYLECKKVAEEARKSWKDRFFPNFCEKHKKSEE